ncbi:MAG: cyclic nucleotide-binding domain-containing protein [Deltaproteobacteria bacterium]|nr:cyclic nucleotide-binding domain-containing protein [Deltaproteobacteria bacterium]
MTAEIIESLLECELFKNLTAQEIKPLSPLCRLETYEAGTATFKQGEKGSRIFIITAGQVTLERTVDLGERKAHVRITTLGSGRAFGSWSVLLGESHTLMSTAFCNRKADVISIDASALRAALQDNPAVGFKVMENLARLLGDRLQGVYGAMERI